MKKQFSSALAVTACATCVACAGCQKQEARPTQHEAYLLCYNISMNAKKEGINSGWIIDERGGTPRTSVTSSYSTLTDISTTDGTAYIREFNKITEGAITLETKITVSSGSGVTLAFRDEDEKNIYEYPAREGTAIYRVTVDLDNGKAYTFVDGENMGESDLTGNNILSFRLGTDAESQAVYSPGTVFMTANYAVAEIFDLCGIDSAYGWTNESEAYVKDGELIVRNGTLKKSFSPVYGKICAEVYFLAKASEDFSLTLYDGEKVAGNFQSVNGTLFGGETEICPISTKVWNRLRVEADLDTGLADVLLNGRKVGECAVNGKSVNALSLTVPNGSVWFDDLYLSVLIEHEDYISAPEKSDDDYLVGMNICSLWTNGTHYGWSCVSPYDEPEPVLGYYDEGLTESADWEIKYMVEHGIDFQAFCWYADVSTGALKRPYAGKGTPIRNQLHDGYMYAKYSNSMKYTIIWEAQNGAKFNSEQFRNYVIPYWFENYFLDPRFLTIENKLVLCVFGGWNLPNDTYFGSAANAKKELDYLREVAKSYGFDGVIILSCGSASDSLAEIGFDGAYAYNWGKVVGSFEVNRTRILESAKCKTLATVPTISVGFDSIPWHGERYPNMTVEDFDKAQQWVKDTYFTKYVTQSWAKNFVMISTWNEYGEGTYVMPSNLNKFGYLDVLRKHYTNLSEEHTDLTPTEEQKERITHLYPQYARLLRREGWYDRKTAYPQGVGDMSVNGIKVENVIRPVVQNGVTLYPFDEGQAIGYRLGAFVTWRKLDGTLKIQANGHTVVYTVNSDTFTADGESKTLTNPVTLIDGIPMLDFATLCDVMGWKYEVKDGCPNIITQQSALYDEINSRTPGIWDFNGYDTEGWTSSNFTLSVGGGAMTCVTTGTTNDPIITNSETYSLPAEQYTDMEIRVRYKYSASSVQSVSMYFLTDRDSTWNEAKSVKFPLKSYSSGEDWETIRISLSTVDAWMDNISQFRFDPFNGTGTMEIDYIRLIAKEGYVYIPPEERPFSISNGDAEKNAVPFYSDNATISRTEDPDNPKNHCYLAAAKSGKNWTYFRQNVTYKEGTTYHVEYDIRLISDNEGNTDISTSVCCNFRYTESTALNGNDHVVNTTQLTPADGWVHCSFDVTVKTIDNVKKTMEFALFGNPIGNASVSFMVDNITVKEK